jgi:hypothetical protein
VLSAGSHADEPDNPKAASPPANDKPAKPKVLVTISKETTYITEPLRPDGYVDYVAALKARYSKGVTPENNAAVLFWKAVGPGEIERDKRDQYFAALGIAPLAENGDYFKPFDTYADFLPQKQVRAAQEFIDSGSIWSRERNTPEIIERWLNAQRQSLSILADASKRTRFFDPLVVAKDQCLLPHNWARDPIPRISIVEVERAFLATAAVKNADGHPEAAWEDLLVLHRLARLCGQSPMFAEAFVSSSYTWSACRGDFALIRSGRLAAATARRALSDLKNLAPSANLRDKVDIGERFVCLDGIIYIARNGFGPYADITGQSRDAVKKEQDIDRGFAGRIDWNLVLRTANHCYDDAADAFNEPTFIKREQALRQTCSSWEDRLKRNKDMKSLLSSPDPESKIELSEGIGLNTPYRMLPPLVVQNSTMASVSMRFDLTKLGFALVAYRSDHDSYPAKLAELAPKYVAEIPKDVFNDLELHYKLDGEGYVIYSVGPNGVDDGGKGMDDAKNGESWDDIALAVPGPEKAKPNP